ncbi:MAG: hypothetical protein IJY42_01275 [Clostridia bacterium]|nr:hypothetical protein [Clostridia bacterium]
MLLRNIYSRANRISFGIMRQAPLFQSGGSDFHGLDMRPNNRLGQAESRFPKI